MAIPDAELLAVRFCN